jgi:hypothetical protein
VEQALFTLPEHLSSTPVSSGAVNRKKDIQHNGLKKKYKGQTTIYKTYKNNLKIE